MAKESVKVRLEGREQGISYTEFSYMLLQAYDSLHLFREYGCRMQVGGSDQWGNITLGIDLIRRVEGEEAYGMAWPLLTRADGSKFGKSESGSIWLSPEKTSPYDFYQYWVNAHDDNVGGYLELFTDLSEEERAGLLAAPPEQRAAQRRLAHEVTAITHGVDAVLTSERASQALFGGDASTLSEEALLALAASGRPGQPAPARGRRRRGGLGALEVGGPAHGDPGGPVRQQPPGARSRPRPAGRRPARRALSAPEEGAEALSSGALRVSSTSARCPHLDNSATLARLRPLMGAQRHPRTSAICAGARGSAERLSATL